MDTSPLKQCSNKKSYEASFEYFSSIEKLTFFRILMGAGAVTCLVALLVFTIQIQDYKVVACMASFTSLNFLLIFIPLKLQIYLKYILSLVYMSYVASVAVIGLIGVNVPLFIHGYASGVMFSTMLQFCECKLKGLLTLSTPWVFLIVFGSFSISNIHFIIYTLCTSVIQGYLNYLYDTKQKKIFSQKEIIKQQKNVIKEFTSDSLFAISYDERSRNFKLEFTNQMFEKNYSDDFKEFLRNHVVLSYQEQLLEKIMIQKHETIEEFLFQQNNKNSEKELSKSFNVLVENQFTKNQHNLQISRGYFAKQIYFIAIKSNQTNIQIEKYENAILKQKQSIINLSNKIGSKFQRLYHGLNENSNMESFKSSSAVLLLKILVIVKNYLIFYQQEKFFSLNCSAEIYELRAVLIPLLQVIEIKCKQYQRFFTYSSLNQRILMRLDQKLLTQIFLNVFYSILKFSSDNSIIRLKVKVVCEENLQLKQLKLTEKSQCSKYDFQNSQEINNQILQFNFTFSSNKKIDNLDSAFCYQEKNENISQTTLYEEITNFVNYLILKMIGPFNQVSAQELHYPVPNQYLYQVTFHIYTDIQNLDPSFMKYISKKL